LGIESWTGVWGRFSSKKRKKGAAEGTSQREMLRLRKVIKNQGDQKRHGASLFLDEGILETTNPRIPNKEKERGRHPEPSGLQRRKAIVWVRVAGRPWGGNAINTSSWERLKLMGQDDQRRRGW